MCSYACSVHCSGVGEELERQNWEKLLGQGKEHFISEGKRKKEREKWCRGNHSLPPTSRPMTTHSLSNACLAKPSLFYHWGWQYKVWSHLPGQCSSAVLAASPPSLLATPSLFPRGGQSEKQRQPRNWASTAQHQPEHWCITNTATVTNLKWSITQAAVKKIISIPTRPSAL